MDSLSGPAFGYLMFIGPALVVALVDRLASRLSVIPGERAHAERLHRDDQQGRCTATTGNVVGDTVF